MKRKEILSRESNVTKVENTYLRHKVMAEAEDEMVVIILDTEYYRHCAIPCVPAR